MRPDLRDQLGAREDVHTVVGYVGDDAEGCAPRHGWPLIGAVKSLSHAPAGAGRGNPPPRYEYFGGECAVQPSRRALGDKLRAAVPDHARREDTPPARLADDRSHGRDNGGLGRRSNHIQPIRGSRRSAADSAGDSNRQVFYVSSTGSDANPGSESQPWATLDKAFASLGAR